MINNTNNLNYRYSIQAAEIEIMAAYSGTETGACTTPSHGSDIHTTWDSVAIDDVQRAAVGSSIPRVRQQGNNDRIHRDSVQIRL
jgi:hypothetical protein